MKKSELQQASTIADQLNDTEQAWLSHESQALTVECAARLIKLGVVEHEMTSRTGVLVYTVRTGLGTAVAAVCAARRTAMSWPEEHRQWLGGAQLELTDMTRAFALTPLFEQRKVKGRNMVCRTPLGTAVHAWILAQHAVLVGDSVS